MKIIFTSQAQDDLAYWRKHDQKMVVKIDQLIQAVLASPFEGIGKPEPLRFQKAGYWARRITQEHRLVYKVHDDVLYIAQCRYHYER